MTNDSVTNPRAPLGTRLASRPACFESPLACVIHADKVESSHHDLAQSGEKSRKTQLSFVKCRVAAGSRKLYRLNVGGAGRLPERESVPLACNTTAAWHGTGEGTAQLARQGECQDQENRRKAARNERAQP